MHASQVLAVLLYLNPNMQVTHSVAFIQEAQFLMQAVQVFGVVVLKVHPSKQSVQVALLSRHYLQLATEHFPNPTSKKKPGLGTEHLPTVSSEHTAHPVAHAVGTNPVAGATAALSQNPTAVVVQVISVADLAVQASQPSGHLSGDPAFNTYPAAAAVQVVASEHAVHPAVEHTLHYLAVAFNHHPALQAVHESLSAEQAVQPFVPSRHE